MKQALQRLEAQGIKASPEQTLREMAVHHGDTRPAELLQIIRGR